jgi:hypothetical protein
MQGTKLVLIVLKYDGCKCVTGHYTHYAHAANIHIKIYFAGNKCLIAYM